MLFHFNVIYLRQLCLKLHRQTESDVLGGALAQQPNKFDSDGSRTHDTETAELQTHARFSDLG